MDKGLYMHVLNNVLQYGTGSDLQGAEFPTGTTGTGIGRST